jgi:pyrroline-5-carboxylate reductase
MKITVIGCGVMGSALAGRFTGQHALFVYDRNPGKVKALCSSGARACSSIKEAVKEGDLIILCVKPKDLPSIVSHVAGQSWEGKVLVSILAGTSLESLASHFPGASIVRGMPNLALIYGQGVTGLAAEDWVSSEDKERVNLALKGTGLTLWMSEKKLEALTALSGSGIAFVIVMIEAMLDGGVYLGFSPQEALTIVLQTMEGAAALVRESGLHPAELKLRISSPGGTTIEGLRVMEEKKVRSGIMQTLIACYEKAVKMR